MPKFTDAERILVKSLVASLSIKRIPEAEIINEIFRQTNKTITRAGLFHIRQQIKKESYGWYEKLRKNNFEYIYEFKERINEIIWLQQKHHEIIKKNSNSPQIQQASLAELHKLNLTLSNYFDVAPDIIGNNPSLSQTSKKNATEIDQENIIV